METHHTPWWPYFLKDQTRFNYFIEILAIGFRGDLKKKNCDGDNPRQLAAFFYGSTYF